MVEMEGREMVRVVTGRGGIWKRRRKTMMTENGDTNVTITTVAIADTDNLPKGGKGAGRIPQTRRRRRRRQAIAVAALTAAAAAADPPLPADIAAKNQKNHHRNDGQVKKLPPPQRRKILITKRNINHPPLPLTCSSSKK